MAEKREPNLSRIEEITELTGFLRDYWIVAV